MLDKNPWSWIETEAFALFLILLFSFLSSPPFFVRPLRLLLLWNPVVVTLTRRSCVVSTLNSPDSLFSH